VTGQKARQRPVSRPDLDDEVALGRRDEIDDRTGGRLIAEKMLAERPTLGHGHDPAGR
jgi:hypothetical protein